MHWLAFVLSDHPDQDPARDFLVEEPPRRTTAVAGSWRSVPAPASVPRSSFSSRSLPSLANPATILS